MRPILTVTALAVALDVLGYVALGAWGVLTASVCGALVVVAAARGSLPPHHRARHRARGAGEGPLAFASYRRISSMIGWTTENHHYYESVTRPFLAATAGALLAERHRVDLQTDPASARDLLGTHVWNLIDPDGARPDPAPLARDELARVIDRLEQL
ncbi:hypothetical protein [Segeticoccus rhizosphaerae]|uniref:hypothetical protein n=1 Tax=Segeticoccus rhizosphaerae TaxID=1104777 RepID=UPI0010BF7A47|nr:hypothetical protein [Ornithinicoccus soli]